MHTQRTNSSRTIQSSQGKNFWSWYARNQYPGIGRRRRHYSKQKKKDNPQRRKNQKPPLAPKSSTNLSTLPAPSQHLTNAWVDLTKVKEAPWNQKTTVTTSEDDATVTTLSEFTKQSVHTLSRSEALEKFNKAGSNLRNFSYRHKKVEVGSECPETSVALQLNQLFCSFEFHHNCLERLKADASFQLDQPEDSLDNNLLQKMKHDV